MQKPFPIAILEDQASLGLVIKVSERCNLACTYCYFFFRGDETFNDHPAYITDEVCDDTVNFTKRVIDSHNIKHLSISLHGGEPLMVPIKRLDRLCTSFYQMVKTTKLESMQIVMQTNGMLISEKWLEIFEKHDIGIGISLDGNKAVNDIARVDKKGRGSYDSVINGYNQLVEAHKDGKGYYPGLLSVVDPKYDGIDMLNHFSDDLKCGFVDFLLPDVHFDEELPFENYSEKMTEFMVDVFRGWTQKNNPDLHIRIIEEVANALNSDAHAVRTNVDLREYRQLLTISSDGTIGPEDTIKTLAPKFRENTFNVKDAELENILQSEVWLELGRARHIKPAGCQNCEWWGVCRGGKISNRYSKANGFNNSSVFCESLKNFYIEIASWLFEKGVDIKDIERRLFLTEHGPEKATKHEKHGVEA